MIVTKCKLVYRTERDIEPEGHHFHTHQRQLDNTGGDKPH